MLRDGRAERIALVGDETSYRAASRRFLVKFKDATAPVPLRRLGDGAVRLFGMALALSQSKDGILLIDEVENGIHHSVQDDFWKMILTTSLSNNIQVLATTHSSDCVKGFAMAINDDKDIHGSAIRLEKDGDSYFAVEYAEHELETVVKNNAEIR